MVLRRKLGLMAAGVLGVGAGVVGLGAVSSGADRRGAPEVARGAVVDDADERVGGGGDVDDDASEDRESEED